MNYDLIMIKEKYGERMMHFCRKYFSTLLEQEGQLFDLFRMNFSYSKFLYEDIINNSLEDRFKNYVYSLVNRNVTILEVSKSSRELFDDAGYILYECKCEEDIQAFTKYYESKERLCTFKGNRLDSCYVFFAIKKNVDEIDRRHFTNPERQDEYGTSVISIQFTRGEINTLSIKNRYNHIVSNPDATYSNNLENIIPGLTRSFEREYNLNINQNECGEFEIPGYVKVRDGKFYKYNYEINNIYYCPGNIIIDNSEVIDMYQEKEKYIIIDYFVLDLVNKKISLYDESIDDSFIRRLQNIKKIIINKSRDTQNKMLTIIFENDSYVFIEINRYNRIVSYSDEKMLHVGDRFLYKNKYLENLNIPNVCLIGEEFLSSNNTLKLINLNNVIRIGSDFLCSNNLICRIEFPFLVEVGDNFFASNNCIASISFVNLIKVGHNFLRYNEKLTNVFMSNLSSAGDNFIQKNTILESLELPNLVNVGDRFLQYNRMLKSINFPFLFTCGDNFLSGNKIINEISLPRLRQVGDNFCYCNRGISYLNMDSLESTGNNFLYCNRDINSVSLNNLRSVGLNFLYNNISLSILELPKLEKADNNFLFGNEMLEYAYLPSLNKYGRCFCNNNGTVKKKILKI